jgi:hypothetical protein
MHSVINEIEPTKSIPFMMSFRGTHWGIWKTFNHRVPDSFPIESARGQHIVCGRPIHFGTDHRTAMRIVRWAERHPEAVYSVSIVNSEIQVRGR